MDRIIYALKRRPIRVVEAVLALAAVLGYALSPELEAEVLAVAAGIVALLEGAQTQTTSKHYPHIDHTGKGDEGIRLDDARDGNPS